MTSFKIGQTYKTRNRGLSVRIICVNRVGSTSVIGLCQLAGDAYETCFFYDTLGRVHGSDARSDMDLMPCTREVTRYLNVYPNWVEDHAWADEVAADKYAGSDRIACIPYKVTLPDDDSEA